MSTVADKLLQSWLQKTEMSLEAARQAIRFCNSYTRLPDIIDLWTFAGLRWDDWLTLLGEEWVDCDNVGEHADTLMEETPLGDLRKDPGARRYLMSSEEFEAFEALPDEIMIYRGCYASNKWGLSWSLEREIAAGFPMLHRYRQEGQPLLVKANARKSEVLALKLGRDEAEIITDRPRHISTTKIRAAQPR
jgi:hypothetical protein